MFSQSEMQIYRYWNGEKYTKADPLRLQMGLAASGIDEEGKRVLLMKTAKPDTPIGKQTMVEAFEAYKHIVAVVRGLFLVKEYQGDDEKEEGLTDERVLELYFDFVTYCNDVKNAHSPLPTS